MSVTHCLVITMGFAQIWRMISVVPASQDLWVEDARSTSMNVGLCSAYMVGFVWMALTTLNVYVVLDMVELTVK